MSANPYPGLRPFEYKEFEFFFAREGQAEEVLRRLQKSHFVAVVGTSGSGKSSLVRAGLLPLLYGGLMFSAGAHWRTAIMRPGNDPIHNLANALVYPPDFVPTLLPPKDNPLDIDDRMKVGVVENILRRSSVGLLDYVKGNSFSEGENLLIVVDQFEELFRFKEHSSTEREQNTRFAEAEEKAAFVKLLLNAVRDVNIRNVYVVITMRSDYLGDCAQFRDLPETINDGQYLIPRMTRDQMREAIEEPAKMADRPARMSELLVNRLLNDIGENQDQLPILQHALICTWNEWNYSSPEITVENYERVGGMQKALSRHADTVYDGLSEDQQIIAEKMFRCLTSVDEGNRETRRETALGQICRIIARDISDVKPVIEVFRGEGRTFLMPPPEIPLEADSIIDIAHESLIRNWDKLAKWVADEAKWARLYRRLADDALLHLQNEVPYWSDPALQIALDWKAAFNPNADWAERYHPAFAQAMIFLEDSRIARERQIAAVKEQQERELRLAYEAVAAKERETEILANSARRLRLMVAALAAMVLVTTALATVSFYFYKQAVKSEASVSESKGIIDLKNIELNQKVRALAIEKDKTDRINSDLTQEKEKTDRINGELTEKETDLKAALKKAEDNAEIAQQARDEAEKNATLARQARDEAEKNAALAKELENKATEALNNERLASQNAENTLKREERSRDALTLMERGNYPKSIELLTGLVKEYDNAATSLKPADRQMGKWWMQLNLGTAQWKNGQPQRAQVTYIEALQTLNEDIDPILSVLRGIEAPESSNAFVNAAFSSNSKDNLEINYIKSATYRKLGQVSRELALNGYGDDQKYFQMAEKSYEKFFDFYEGEGQNRVSQYILEIRKERGDVFLRLNKFAEAKTEFGEVLSSYGSTNTEDLRNAAEIRKKLSEIELKQGNYDGASKQIKESIRSFESTNNRDDLLMPELYDSLALLYTQRSGAAKQKATEIIRRLNDKRTEAETPDVKQQLEKLKEEKLAEQEKYSVLAADYSPVAAGLRNLQLPVNKSFDIDDFSFDRYTDLANAFKRINNCRRAFEAIKGGLNRARTVAASKEQIDSLFLPTQLLKAANYISDNLDDKAAAREIYLEFVKIVTDENIVETFGNSNALNDRKIFEFYVFNRDLQGEKRDPAISMKLSEAYLTIRKARAQKNYLLTDVFDGYVLLANIYSEQADFASAEAKYREGLEYIENFKFEKYPSNPTISESALKEVSAAYGYYRLANFYNIKLKKKDLAQQLLRTAVETFRRYPKSDLSYSYEILSLKKSAEIEKEQKDNANAAIHFEQAIFKLENYEQVSRRLRFGLYFSPSGSPNSRYKLVYAEMLDALVEIKGTGNAALVKKRDDAREAASPFVSSEEEEIPIEQKPSCKDGVDPESEDRKREDEPEDTDQSDDN